MDNKENIWNKLYEDYINKEFTSWEEYFNIKMKLKKEFFKSNFKVL